MDVVARFGLSFLNSNLSDIPSAARWWSEASPIARNLPVQATEKPRFDTALLERLQALQAAARALAGQSGAYADHSLAGFEAAFERGRPAIVRGEDGSLRAGCRALDAAGSVLLPAAYAVACLLSSEHASRVRRCAGPDCAAYFYDETKNGSRRWCSLTCMERFRAPQRRLRR